MQSVLVLGCGLISKPLIDYLETYSIPVTIATRTPSSAVSHPAVNVIAYDIAIDLESNNMKGLVQIIRSAEIPVGVIVSILPYVYHVDAARVALAESIHFFTASYVSDAMQLLDNAARSKDLLFLNEIGVDPGLDHMSALRIIHEVHSRGGKVISFKSICGGLPALESNNNPIGYKLSWSPRGVLMAGSNNARYLHNNKELNVPGSELFSSSNIFHDSIEIDGVPIEFEWSLNRDSIKYLSVYGLEKETQTIIRGTYRFPGWAKFMKAVSILGLNSSIEIRAADPRSKCELACQFLHCPSGTSLREHISERISSSRQIETDDVIQKFEWLGLFDESILTLKDQNIKSPLDLMSILMASKMKYKEDEKDMIVMKHEFEVEYTLNHRQTIVSTLINIGLQPDGDSSMARTVALPVGVAVRALLEGRLAGCNGVKRPVEPQIYKQILDEMEQHGVCFTEQTLQPHLWIRDEIKSGEKRTPIVPSDAKVLVKAGFRLTVERSSSRCYPDSEFATAGCHLVEPGSWVSAPPSAIILGLKELPEASFSLQHRHLYFAHAFKQQTGWKELLTRFDKGGGYLWDLEFLTDDEGCRVASFGYAAGIVGMAMGALAYAFKQMRKNMPAIDPFVSTEKLSSYVKNVLAKVPPLTSIVIVGALGRCGRGAVHMATLLGLRSILKTWDINETSSGGPFPTLLDSEIIVNCISLGNNKIPPFLITELIMSTPEYKLQVLSDVSCDITSPNNPFPVYSQGSTLHNPVQRVHCGKKSLDVVAIDNLPAVIPNESSFQFSAALLPYLHALVNPFKSTALGKAGLLFEKKKAEAIA